MLDRFKKRRVQVNRTFTVIVTEFKSRTGITATRTDDSYEEYPMDAYCARTKRRKHGVRSVECIEVGCSRTKATLADVHRDSRPIIHIVEPIEESEREAILHGLWNLTDELYHHAQVFGGTKGELWSRVVTAFLLGKSLPTDPALITQKDILQSEPQFEPPEVAE